MSRTTCGPLPITAAASTNTPFKAMVNAGTQTLPSKPSKKQRRQAEQDALRDHVAQLSAAVVAQQAKIADQQAQIDALRALFTSQQTLPQTPRSPVSVEALELPAGNTTARPRRGIADLLRTGRRNSVAPYQAPRSPDAPPNSPTAIPTLDSPVTQSLGRRPSAPSTRLFVHVPNPLAPPSKQPGNAAGAPAL